MLSISSPIVSVNWLYEHINNKNLIILDGTIQKVTDTKAQQEDPLYIKNALFFDIKKEFSDVKAPFPNTMISADEFQLKVQELGINNNSCVVVYDRYGYYSCPRVWWMFKAMGFENIAVLDGGLPEWINAEYPVQDKPKTSIANGNFTSKFMDGMIHDYIPVLDAIEKKEVSIVDARASNRFMGLVDEPRHGLRSGHIPTSKNLPYTSLLDGVKMKPETELKKLFSEVTSDHLIFSCGSGITACVLALGAEVAGIKHKSIYDGSWTEWGSLLELPIEK